MVDAISAPTPPHLERLSISGSVIYGEPSDDTAPLSDNELKAIVSAMGLAGREQLKQFQLTQAHRITDAAIVGIVESCPVWLLLIVEGFGGAISRYSEPGRTRD